MFGRRRKVAGGYRCNHAKVCFKNSYPTYDVHSPLRTLQTTFPHWENKSTGHREGTGKAHAQGTGKARGRHEQGTGKALERHTADNLADSRATVEILQNMFT